MSEVVLVTDSCCDLSPDVVADAGVEVVPLSYIMDGVEHPDDLGQTIPYDELYRRLEAGSVIQTAQAPVVKYLEAFERLTAGGRSVVYAAFSSVMSGSFEASVMAREQFLAGHPDAEVHCVNSMCASTGQGLLALGAAEVAGRGASAEEVVRWIEENRMSANHIFTVDSFEHLVRGGRVSRAVGAVGSVLDIKPVMYMDPSGALAVLKKPRGRHHAISMIADMVADRVGDRDQLAYACHGDCPEDAAELRRAMMERAGLTHVRIGRIGSVIGAHTGPGVLSAFFWGEPRA